MRNINVKGASGEDSDRYEKHVIRNWKKDHPQEVLLKLAKLYSAFQLQKVDLISQELRNFTQEISKQSVKDMYCLCLFVFSSAYRKYERKKEIEKETMKQKGTIIIYSVFNFIQLHFIAFYIPDSLFCQLLNVLLMYFINY